MAKQFCGWRDERRAVAHPIGRLQVLAEAVKRVLKEPPAQDSTTDTELAATSEDNTNEESGDNGGEKLLMPELAPTPLVEAQTSNEHVAAEIVEASHSSAEQLCKEQHKQHDKEANLEEKLLIRASAGEQDREEQLADSDNSDEQGAADLADEIVEMEMLCDDLGDGDEAIELKKSRSEVAGAGIRVG